MAEQRVVIVGTGQGGLQAAASLREAGFAGRVTLVGDEPDLPYQRPPLSKAYLLGKMAEEACGCARQAFFAKNGIELLRRRAGRGDRPGDAAGAADLGSESSATTTSCWRPARATAPLPVPGADLDGVLYLRTLAEDVRRLRDRCRPAGRGGRGAGFIGLEFAAVARQLGKEVTVVEATQRPMGRAVSAEMSWFFTERAHGLGREAAARGRRGALDWARVAAWRPSAATDGAAARRPTSSWSGSACCRTPISRPGPGLPVEDGIVVDAQLRTADPAISAIGDCARYPSRFAAGRCGSKSVQNAADQGRCVAARIAGTPGRLRRAAVVLERPGRPASSRSSA